MRLQSLLVGIVCLATVGCADNVFLTKQAAELATVGALVETEATVPEAQALKSIAISLKVVVNNDGEIDAELIKSFIIAQVVNQFDDPKDRVVYAIMATKIADIVIHYLQNKPLTVSTDDQINVLVVAAADGIISGCDIYVAAFGPEVKAFGAHVESLQAEVIE